MKTSLRILTSAALFAFLTSAAWATDEKVDATKLPQAVAKTLDARFPGATITTATKTKEKGEVIYDIEMTRDGRKHEMDVREDGSIVNFENQIAPDELPAAVTEAVRAKYPKSRIKEAMAVMVVKEQKDTVEEYEVLIETASKKERELTVSPDGKIH